MIKKIGILTSGGDAPGMNNAVRAVAKKALLHNIEPLLIKEGYKGILTKQIVPAKNFDLDKASSEGGTIIFSSRFPEFQNNLVRQEAKAILDEFGIQALVAIGGDGTYKGAYELHKLGVKVIGLPGTIDNDIQETDFTIGFDTALNSIVESVDRLRDTSRSHKRCFIVEVMGRDCQDLALYGGIATGAEIIITNTHILTEEQIVNLVDQQMNQQGKTSTIVLTSEHIYKDLKAIAKFVENKTGIATRAMSLEHTQRGGRPTAFERILATQMGHKAVELLLGNKSGLAITHKNGKIEAVDITKVFVTKQPQDDKLVLEYNKLNQI
ncbi:6-phosphofructokinase [Mesomycoplasma hyorhinis]|uniref:6-phosphofructokinase n=1 Tax=Mesomycoplasma hyorhinis TaxID=2100 RepID=UPI001C04C9D9|nr:6-phosphofructokinase [Mesomycoplasma hyorhinis]